MKKLKPKLKNLFGQYLYKLNGTLERTNESLKLTVYFEVWTKV
jgi:hypothetical protein